MKRRTFLKSTAIVGSGLAFPFVRSAKAATAHQVAIQGFKFSPASLKVSVGDTVTFTNQDSAPHTASARDKSWTTRTLKKGQSETIEITAKSGKEYFCKIHPSMTGKLVIG